MLPPTVWVCPNIPHGEIMCCELRKSEKHCIRLFNLSIFWKLEKNVLTYGTGRMPN